jgi:hypothetical protein
MTFLQNNFSTAIKKFFSFAGVQSMLIMLAFTCFVSPLQGQSLTDSPTGFTIHVYGGAGITTLGPGTTAGITVRSGGHQFTFRGISTDTDPAGETWEIAGLYGRVIAVRTFHISAGAGVGVVGGRGYSQLFAIGSRENLETMIGFPLEGRITWKPVRQAGLGLHGFANINTVQPISGMALTLHLGF